MWYVSSWQNRLQYNISSADYLPGRFVPQKCFLFFIHPGSELPIETTFKTRDVPIHFDWTSIECLCENHGQEGYASTSRLYKWKHPDGLRSDCPLEVASIRNTIGNSKWMLHDA